MKKLLIGIAAVLATALVVWAIVAVESNLYEREITAYADSAILAIASNWDEQALLQRASPELLAASNRQEIDENFVTYRRLGRMIGLSKGMGRLQVVYSTAGERVIVAVYIAQAQFERRNVAIKVSMIKHEAGWQIMGFDIMPSKPPDRGTDGNGAAFRASAHA